MHWKKEGDQAVPFFLEINLRSLIPSCRNLLLVTLMLTQTIVEELVRTYLSAYPDYELITCHVTPSLEILVEVDSYNGVDLLFCEELNRYLQQELDKTGDNYQLEVGSVSITDPFKTLMQYNKHLGQAVELLTKDGKKLHGQLVNVEADFFEVDVETMVQVEGKKKKQKEMVTHRFGYDDVKYCRYDLKV